MFNIYILTICPAEEEPPEDTVSSLLTGSEAVDELFFSTFNCIRDITGDAITKICDFVGELKLCVFLKKTCLQLAISVYSWLGVLMKTMT